MQTMKKYLIIVVIGLGLFGGYKSLLYISEHGIINLNTLTVNTSSPLDNSKVKVIQGQFSINRKNDSELFYDWPANQIIFNVFSRHKPQTGHGENDFLVIYDNKYYFQFRHFQTNESKNSSFNFNLMQVDTSLYLTVKVNDRIKFKREMKLINQSQLFLTNRPLDSIKSGVYNGIELK